MKDKKSLIIIILIIVLVGFLSYTIGFAQGAIYMADWGVEKAVYFLELKGLELGVDENLIAYEVYRYKNNIGQC